MRGRVLEAVVPARIRIADRADFAVRRREADAAVVARNEIPVLVRERDLHHAEFPVALFGRQHDAHRLARRPHGPLARLGSVRLVGDDLEFPRLPRHVLPDETVARQDGVVVRHRTGLRVLRAPSEGLPVQEQFRLARVRIDVDGRPEAGLEVPVGRHGVERVRRGVPVRPVEPVAVLGERQQVADAEVGTARRVLVAEARRRVRRGFAQIVDARPHEFAGAVGVAFHAQELAVGDVAPARGVPVARIHAKDVRRVVRLVRRQAVRIEAELRQRGRALRIEERLVRARLLDVRVHAAVVPARQVERGVVAAVGRLGEAAADRHGARGVLLANRQAEASAALGGGSQRGMARPVFLSGRGGFAHGDLVADGPGEHAGVQPVAAHEAAQVAFHEWLQRFVAAPAGVVPLVEALVPHEDAHLVAEVQDLWRGRIVRGAQGVRPHVAHDLQLPARRILVERHAQRPQVRMQVDAVELHALTVQDEALLRVEREGAEADAPRQLVREALARDRERKGIEVRIARHLPALHLRHRELGREIRRAPRRDGNLARGRGDGLARGVQDLHGHRSVHVAPCAALERRGNRRVRRAVHDAVRIRPDGIVRDVEVVRLDPRHLAVHAPAGIPAREEVLCVAGDLDRVGTRHQIGRGVRPEAQVAVFAAPAGLAVDERRGARHDTVEIQEDAPLGLGREHDRLAVASSALPGQLARTRLPRRIERTGDGPVVRNLHRRERRAFARERPAFRERFLRPRRAQEAAAQGDPQKARTHPLRFRAFRFRFFPSFSHVVCNPLRTGSSLVPASIPYFAEARQQARSQKYWQRGTSS